MATPSLKKSFASLILIILCIGTAKFFLKDGALHAVLFGIFLGGAFYLSGRPKLFAFLGRPQSLLGKSFCLLYLAATFAGFFLFAKEPNFGLVLSQTFAAPQGVLLYCLLVPLFEELFFRGAVQDVVTLSFAGPAQTSKPSRNQTFWVVYISAFLFWICHLPLDSESWRFAIAHGGLPLGPGPFLLGLFCGWIRAQDNSLRYSILLHAMCNLFGVIWAHTLADSLLLQIFYSL